VKKDIFLVFKSSTFQLFFVPLSPEKSSEPACRCSDLPFRDGEEERKVRATQGIPLPNGKRFARASRRRRKQPPKQARVRRWGKSPPGWQ